MGHLKEIKFDLITNDKEFKHLIHDQFKRSPDCRNYCKKLEKIASLTKEWLGRVAISLPEFPEHGAEHSFRVVSYIRVLVGILNRIITPPLKYQELFLLYAAGLLHDIALMPLSKNKDLKIKCEDACHSMRMLDFTYEDYKATDWQRHQHHNYAPDVIKEILGNDKAYLNLAGPSLNDDISRIGLLAEAHRRSSIDDIRYSSIRDVRMRYLVVVLRLADTMDLTCERVEGRTNIFRLLIEENRLTSKDIAHWFKHVNVLGFKLFEEKEGNKIILHIKVTLTLPNDPAYFKELIIFLTQPFQSLRSAIYAVFHERFSLCFKPDSCNKCNPELNTNQWHKTATSLKMDLPEKKIVASVIENVRGTRRIPYPLKHFTHIKKTEDWAIVIGDRNLYPADKEKSLKRTSDPMDIFPIIRTGLGKKLELFSDKMIIKEKSLLGGKHLLIVGGILVNSLARKLIRETVFKISLERDIFDLLVAKEIPQLRKIQKLCKKDVDKIKNLLATHTMWKEMISKEALYTDKYYTIISKCENALCVIDPFNDLPLKAFEAGKTHYEYRGVLSLCNHPVSKNKMAIVCSGTNFISTIGILQFLLKGNNEVLRQRPLGGVIKTCSDLPPGQYDSTIVLHDCDSDWETEKYTIDKLEERFRHILRAGEYVKYDYPPDAVRNFLVSLSEMRK